MRRSVFYLAITLAWSGCTCASDVAIAPPRVPEGGRAVAIAVNQSNGKNLIVATESGGLFRTFDGGVSFQHLDGFPTYAPIDVAFASLNPHIVVATARDDFRVPSGGGIWRSTDDGASWSRPAGWPPSNPACASRPAASGISQVPLATTFYVATDCGLAVSTDNGATFSMVTLEVASSSKRTARRSPPRSRGTRPTRATSSSARCRTASFAPPTEASRGTAPSTPRSSRT